ncbi:hypothetical protein F5884DRAFT_849632 [Xylogone sp. PMI_703]|nr:hypothetical protein F5884DRAFT_849632 [Xylogone sp. PMI_703]
MPALTVNTAPSAATGTPAAGSQVTTTPPNGRSNTGSHSRSSSPVQPPYSPITPTLGPARLPTAASTSTSPRAQDGSSALTTSTTQLTRIYSHSQPNQTSMPQPPLERISFDSNPDALALKSAISILQIQQRKAVGDIQNLQRIKERAMEDPEGFARALAAGKVKTRSDPLFSPSAMDEDDEDDEEDAGGAYNNGNGGSRIPGSSMPATLEESTTAWPVIPTPQNIVRCPPINWTQYAIIGDSLDKLHADQQAKPTDGVPAKPGPDGTLVFGEGPRRLSEAVLAAPYTPGKDRIEKPKKAGKR